MQALNVIPKECGIDPSRPQGDIGGLKIIFAFIIFNKPLRGLLEPLGCRKYVLVDVQDLYNAGVCLIYDATWEHLAILSVHEAERSEIHLETFNISERLVLYFQNAKTPLRTDISNGERPHLQSCFPHPCLMQGLSCLSVGVSLSGEDGTRKAGTRRGLYNVEVASICRET